MQSVETCANQCLRGFLHKVIHRFAWITEKSSGCGSNCRNLYTNLFLDSENRMDYGVMISAQNVTV